MKPPLKILVATGSFKDVYSPMEACEMIQRVLKDIGGEKTFEIETVPLADGGEYSTEVLLSQEVGERIDIEEVVDPRGETTQCSYLRLDKETAFIASSSILRMGPEMERFKNPLHLTSYGLGQLIDDALHRGFNRILVALGGTSTVDGGIGMAQALGAEFRDADGQVLKPANAKYFSGHDLSSIFAINTSDLRDRSPGIIVEAFGDADVNMHQMDVPTNQKIGAPYSSERLRILKTLKDGLSHYARIVSKTLENENRMPGPGFGHIELWPFSGAAGSILLGLLLLFETKVSLGIDFFLKTFDVEDLAKHCDLVITGEGKTDNSVYGKSPIGVSRLSKQLGKPAILLCGDVGDELKSSFQTALCTNPPKELQDNGVTAIISCHKYNLNAETPGSSKEAAELHRKNTPKIFEKELSLFFTEHMGMEL